MYRLAGKTAVVTGGGSVIGLATAKRFVEEGAFVYIFGRRQKTLDAALAELGPNARAMRGSVSDLADLDRLFETVKAERGHFDILFANAGTGELVPLGKITPEHYEQTFDTNVKGTLFTVQKALPLMSAGASIIRTGSSTGGYGNGELQRLQRHQGSDPQLCAFLGAGPEGYRHSRQCSLAGTDTDRACSGGRRRGGHGRVGRRHAARPSRRPLGNGCGCGLSGVQRQQLHDRK